MNHSDNKRNYDLANKNALQKDAQISLSQGFKQEFFKNSQFCPDSKHSPSRVFADPGVAPLPSKEQGNPGESAWALLLGWQAARSAAESEGPLG